MAYFEKSKLFMSTRDYNRFAQIIDPTETDRNQCFFNYKACWQNLINFNHKDSIFFYKEEYKSNKDGNSVLEGVWRTDDKPMLMRQSTKKGTTLFWRNKDGMLGKMMSMYEGDTKCNKYVMVDQIK